MKKNTADQKWRVYAWHRSTGVPATGIAATITATINKDDVGEVAVADTNPTEVAGGYYDFDLSQAETNAYKVSLTPATTTNGAGVKSCPGTEFTQVELTATGLDAITATRPTGKATTFPQMLVQLFYRFFGKATKTSTQLKTYAADGTTVVTTQTVSDDATTETQGEAS